MKIAVQMCVLNLILNNARGIFYRVGDGLGEMSLNSFSGAYLW